MLQQLFSFKGGVKPQTRKAPSVQSPIGQAPTAVAPVRAAAPEHRRCAESAGQAGEHVLKGR
jgi:electron transport complex protein RnfC